MLWCSCFGSKRLDPPTTQGGELAAAANEAAGGGAVFRLGFHAAPSMKQLHMHARASTSLKLTPELLGA